MLNTGSRRSASAAIMACDQDDIRLGLSHAGGDRAHAYFRDQLHVDSRMNIGVLQIVDELLEILNRIDVVMRWG